MKLMPAGTGSLNEVPTLERYVVHCFKIDNF